MSMETEALKLLAAHPQGLHRDAMVQIMGGDTASFAATLGANLARLIASGAVVWVHDPEPPKSWNRKRYHAAEHAPRVHGKATIERAAKKYLPKPKAGIVPLHTKAAANAPVICNVEPTVCPGFQGDDRFKVDKPTPFFSAMAIGSYAPSDSWAARVYG